MSTISRVTTWSDNQVLTASALNGEFNNVLNDYNGGITNSNISAAAAITESKITFSGSGHGHSGGADGKVISTAKYGFFIPGTPSVANDLSWNPRAPATMTASRLDAYARTAPTGSSLTIQIYNVTQAVAVASISITAGNQSATQSSMTNGSLNQGDVLRADVTAVGSIVAGANISLVLS